MSESGGAPPPKTYFRPRESERSIYTEKKIGDDWRAFWETENLAEDAAITHVTMIPYRGERVVVAGKDGTSRLPEGDVRQGEGAVAAMKRIANEQCGIVHANSKHLGHYRYTASSYNKEVPAGTTTYHALYVLEVKELGDAPADESFERRIVLQRDLNQILRTSYVESRREYADALDRWLLERLKTESTARE